MIYYIYGKRTKVYAFITTDHKVAQDFLKHIKQHYPQEEWVLEGEETMKEQKTICEKWEEGGITILPPKEEVEENTDEQDQE